MGFGRGQAVWCSGGCRQHSHSFPLGRGRISFSTVRFQKKCREECLPCVMPFSTALSQQVFYWAVSWRILFLNPIWFPEPPLSQFLQIGRSERGSGMAVMFYVRERWAGFQSGLVWAEQKAWPKILKKAGAPRYLDGSMGRLPFSMENRVSRKP